MAALSLAFDVVANDRNATRTFNTVGDAADRAGKKGSAFGTAMKAGIGMAVGAIATLGLGSALRTFIDEANEAAKVGRLTDAVITSTGGAANVTAQQVGDLAEALSNKAAVDDELIQSGANVLLTFTKVRNEMGEGNDIFNQATEAALNMSAALGTDMQAASIQLGKALNDPIKGVTALGRAGVSFTQQQKDQIKAMVEAGDVLGAQKIILSEMQTQFGGAAEAIANPMDRLRVVAGNLGEAIGGALLPYVNQFATYVSDRVLPAVSSFIDEFVAGEGAGGRFKDTLVSVKDGVVAAYSAFQTAKDVVTGLFDLLVKGDYTGSLAESLGIYEDDEIVSKLLTLRDVVIDFGAKLGDLWGQAQAAGTVLMDSLKPVWDTLVFVWNNDLKPAFTELFTVLRDELGPLFGQTAANQGPMIQKAAEFAAVLIKTAVPAIVVTAQFLASFIRTIASFVKPMVDAYQASVRFGAQLALLGRQVQTAMGQTVSAVQNLPGLVAAAVRGAGNYLVDAGRDLVGGLIRGITDRAGSAVQAIRETVSKMVNAAKSLLQIQSPSKVFEGIGVNTVEGLTKGLERTGGLDSAMNSLMTKVSLPTPAVPAGSTQGSAAQDKRPMYLVLPNGRVLAEVVEEELGRKLESVY